MPLVSIILPNYNHAPYLKERLDSIFNQAFQDFELILLDDASNDESISILSEYAQNPKVTHFIVNQNNSGSPFLQWEKGIRLAKGEYIWIAESDDWNDSDFLSSCIEKLESDLMISGAICNIISINPTGEIIKHWKRYKEGRVYGKNLIEHEFIHHNYILNASAVVFRNKNLLDKISWKELAQYKFCGDWFFWIQLFDNSVLYCIEHEYCYWRNHTANVTNSSVKNGVHITEGLLIASWLLRHHSIPLKKQFNGIFKWEKTISKGDFNEMTRGDFIYLVQQTWGIKYWAYKVWVFIGKVKNKRWFYSPERGVK